MLLLELAVYGTGRLIHGQNILRSSSFFSRPEQGFYARFLGKKVRQSRVSSS